MDIHILIIAYDPQEMLFLELMINTDFVESTKHIFYKHANNFHKEVLLRDILFI